MTNYLLSIDPSLKNTGFTLWKKELCKNNKYNLKDLIVPHYDKNSIWKPILVISFDFKKYDTGKFLNKIEDKITDYCFLDNLDLIIERGTFHSKNGIGYETQEHLRGFIAGQFNKLITKDMLISPTKWKSWWIKGINEEIIKFDWIGIGSRAWDKDLSLEISNWLIKENNWNITISNHDEADSLLIGWYYLNKEVK